MKPARGPQKGGAVLLWPAVPMPRHRWRVDRYVCLWEVGGALLWASLVHVSKILLKSASREAEKAEILEG